jgi:hypothetical protein
VSRGLPTEVRKYLDATDARVDALDNEDRAGLAEQAALTLSLYQGLPEVVLARLIMESAVALDGCLARAARPGGNLEQEIRTMLFNTAALCSVLTRKARGRPELR